MASNSTVNSVIWCYLNPRRLWKAYEPSDCQHIENAFSAFVNNSSGTGGSGPLSQSVGIFGPAKIHLGLISQNSSLASYEIDLSQMKQVHIPSGRQCPVKRTVVGPNSPLSTGVVWEFEGDAPHGWAAYDLDTMQLLEEGFHWVSSGNWSTSALDLRQTNLPQPYIIDFSLMTQTRVDTGKVRSIQRRSLTQLYPIEVLSSSSLASFAVSGQSPSTSISQPSNTSLSARGRHSHHRPAPYTTVIPMTLNSHGHSQGTIAGAHHIQTVSSGAQTKSYGGSSGVLPFHHQQQLHNQNLQQHNQQQSHNWHLNVQPSSSGQSLPPSQQQSVMMSLGTSGITLPHLSVSQTPFHGVGASSAVSSIALGSTHMTSTLPGQLHISSTSGPTLVSPATFGSPHISSTVSQGPSITESLPSESLITISKPKSRKNTKVKEKAAEEVLSSYMQAISEGLESTNCAICCEKLCEESPYGEGHPEGSVAIRLAKCFHEFHKMCLIQMYHSIHKDASLQCPSCKTIYGEKTGNCPPGTMTWRLAADLHLAGHENQDTLVVTYNIPSGVQGAEHPNPRQRYSARGFPRTGFIPDCNKGRKLLKLLIVAFKRRLMFTIGTSMTTGESGTVTWNEIHHKTEPYGNRGHGYPDPNYIDNAIGELAAHGVTEECLSHQ